MDVKVCKLCGQSKPIADYTFPNARTAPRCRACRVEAKRVIRRMRGAPTRAERAERAQIRREEAKAKREVAAQARAMREPVKKKYALEYYTWQSMIQRCTRQNHPKYPRYGGRGIVVCDRWRKSFAAFLSDVGVKPGRGLSIDRINNDGNYEPGNVRWADDYTQQRNKSNNVSRFASIRRVRTDVRGSL